MVKRNSADGPVYTVRPERGGNAKVVHRNQMKPCTYETMVGHSNRKSARPDRQGDNVLPKNYGDESFDSLWVLQPLELTSEPTESEGPTDCDPLSSEPTALGSLPDTQKGWRGADTAGSDREPRRSTRETKGRLPLRFNNDYVLT